MLFNDISLPDLYKCNFTCGLHVLDNGSSCKSVPHISDRLLKFMICQKMHGILEQCLEWVHFLCVIIYTVRIILLEGSSHNLSHVGLDDLRVGSDVGASDLGEGQFSVSRIYPAIICYKSWKCWSHSSVKDFPSRLTFKSVGVPLSSQPTSLTNNDCSFGFIHEERVMITEVYVFLRPELKHIPQVASIGFSLQLRKGSVMQFTLANW